ncbi:MAG TPA: CHAT domain-containing protein, partial [Thermoanaerobaculia bacterium]|nr:CHAT domain-containing protein [Thermoanaerobaculia bacterium]
SRDTPAEMLADAANSLEHRVVEGRLSGGFDYKPLRPVVRNEGKGASEPIAMSVIGAVAKVQRAQSDVSPSALHATAVSHLLLGNWDGAVEKMEAALRQETQREDRAQAIAESKNVALLSDAAAAYHARGRNLDEPRSFVIAVEAAERAWRLAPSPETAWNRALAIESLHLRESSIAAWGDYLKLDPDSPWAGEVRERIARLQKPTTADEWTKQNVRLEEALKAGDGRTAVQIVRAFPLQARMLAEHTYLLDWAMQYDGASAGREKLEYCDVIAGALRANGESMLYDTLTDIERASPQRRGEIARALRLYNRAKTNYSADLATEAGKPLRAAHDALKRADSPFALMALMYWLRCESRDDDQRALAVSDAWFADGSVDESRYPAAAAQMRWVRGASLMRIGRPQSAIQEYERAMALFERIGELDNVAAMHLMLTEAYDYVGDSATAWKHRYPTLERIDASGGGHGPLLETMKVAAIAALEEGFPLAAIVFLDRQVASSTEPATFLRRFQALMWRAVAHRMVGEQTKADQDLAKARTVAALIPDPNERTRALHDPDVLRDRLARVTDAPQREAILAAAVAYTAEKKLGFRLAQVYREQAREHLRMGRRAEAEAALFAAADELENQRGEIRDAERRGTFFSAREPIYAELAALLCSRGEYGPAFEVVERSRARTLLDQVTGSGSLRSLPQIQASLAAHTLVVAFAPMGGKLGVWLVSRTDVSFVQIDIASGELKRLVDRFRIALRGRDERATLLASQELHRAVVLPWYARARSFERLVFIPTPELDPVPFAALSDGTQFLVQRHVLSTAPSANLLVACTLRDGKLDPRNGTALIVAPATSAAGRGDDVLLPATRTEVTDVSGNYTQPSILAGRQATRSAFVEQAPGAAAIHFAGHAGADRSLLPRLVFAPEGAAQNFMYAEDVRALRLTSTRVVVLAACDSRSESSTKGTQGTSSLARAFLAAGAPVVVGSYWEVEDAAAAQLSRGFHSAFARGHDALAALRVAQLQMLASSDARSKRVGSWAAFAAIGGSYTSERRHNGNLEQ